MSVGLKELVSRFPWNRWRFCLIAVGIGLAVRTAALVFTARLPFWTHYRLDAALYHDLGRAFAAGDIALGNEVLHMSPGYSWLVGCLYVLFGSGPLPVRIVQLLLGLVTIAVVYEAARLAGGERTARIAALATALYGPFIFYEENILVASWATFLDALLIYATLRAEQAGHAVFRRWLAVGLIWGLAIIARPNALLLVIVLIAALALGARGRSVFTRGLAGVFLGAALIVSPVTLRNYLLTGEPVLVTDSGGMNFYLGNGPGARGVFRVPKEMPRADNAAVQFPSFVAAAEKETGHSMTRREANAFWYDKTLRAMATDPAGWLRLLGRKALLFWNAYEVPNTYDYQFFREINPVLGLPLVQFNWIAPFALLGLVLVFRSRQRPQIVVAGFNLVFFSSIVAFFVLSHYRVSGVPGLIITAAFCIDELWTALAGRKWPLTVACILALAGGAILVNLQLLDKPFDDEYFKLGYAYHMQGDVEAAAFNYQAALAINPENISAHKNMAMLLENEAAGSGRAKAEAIGHWRMVEKLARRWKDEKRLREAQNHLERMLGPSP